MLAYSTLIPAVLPPFFVLPKPRLLHFMPISRTLSIIDTTQLTDPYTLIAGLAFQATRHTVASGRYYNQRPHLSILLAGR
jgi:hypothetical protein